MSSEGGGKYIILKDNTFCSSCGEELFQGDEALMAEDPEDGVFCNGECSDDYYEPLPRISEMDDDDDDYSMRR